MVIIIIVLVIVIVFSSPAAGSIFDGLATAQTLLHALATARLALTQSLASPEQSADQLNNSARHYSRCHRNLPSRCDVFESGVCTRAQFLSFRDSCSGGLNGQQQAGAQPEVERRGISADLWTTSTDSQN